MPEDAVREELGTVKIAGDRTVSIVKGDITLEAVGAIACPATETLEYSDGIAWDVLDNGGNIIRDETDMYIAKYGLIKESECVVSSSGKLPCSNIIHCVVPQWRGGGSNERNALKLAIINLLKLASNLKTPVIALPPVGAVTRGFPRTVAVDVIWKAICEYFNGNSSSPISTIVLVARGRNTALCFQKTIENNPFIKQSHIIYLNQWVTECNFGKSNLIVHLVAPGNWSSKGCMGRITKRFGSAASKAFTDADHWPGAVISTEITKGVMSAAVVVLKNKGEETSIDLVDLQKGLSYINKNAKKYQSRVFFHRPSEGSIQDLDWSAVHDLLDDTFGGSHPIPVTVCSSEAADFKKYKTAPGSPKKKKPNVPTSSPMKKKVPIPTTPPVVKKVSEKIKRSQSNFSSDDEPLKRTDAFCQKEIKKTKPDF